jgi:hypothetical protein
MSTFKKLALILLIFATVSAVAATEYPFYTMDDNETVWTKVNLTTGENIFYITSGGGSVPDASATFEMSDFFPGTELDSQWTTAGTGTATVEDGHLTLYSPSSTMYVFSNEDTFEDVKIITRANISSTVGDYKAPELVLGATGGLSSGAAVGIRSRQSARDDRIIIQRTGTTLTSKYVTDITTDEYYIASFSSLNGDYNLTIPDDSITASDSTYLTGKVGLGINSGAVSYDYILVVKTVENEPVITNITQISENTIKITVTSTGVLDNYQINVNASQLSLSSQSESILVTDTYSSDSDITLNVTDITNRTITMDYNSTVVDHAVINWGDGTSTTTYEENTELTHNYDYDKNFTITARGYDESENLLNIETTSAYILLDIEYVENYYTILMANPYGELSDYPLNLTFDSDNFDWWNTDIDPIGTNIYFRTNDTIYEHQIIEWAPGSTTGNIYVNISEIPANDYLTFYMCFASYDYPQFEVNTETEYTLLWTITDFQQQEEDNNDTFERVSTDVEEYQNITVVFVDEQTFISGCLKSGTISFSDENGGRVVYTFEQPVLGILEVSAASENGTILVATSDGITRELTYSSSSALNIVTLPNSYTVPITISAPGDVEVYTNGYLVTTAVAPADIYLALNAKYDIYLNSEALRTDYVVTKEDILYETITAVKTVDTTVVDYHLDGETITATISATSTATLEIEGTTNYSIENVTTITGIEKDSHYKLYNASGAVIEEGIFYGIDVGYLGLLNSQFSEKTSAIIALFVIGVTLLTGTYVSLHYTMTLATMEVALFSYMDLIPFDPLTKSILTLIAFAVALLMWVKR